MSFTPGISLHDFWFSKHPTISDDEQKHRRVGILEDVASVIVQLGQFRFPTGGRLLFDNHTGNLVGVSPHRRLDHRAFEKQCLQNPPDFMRVYYQSGPYTTANEFHTGALDREPPGASSFLQDQQRLLRFFIDCMVNFFNRESGPAEEFVLTHPDFDIRNFIVSPEGRLVGIIAWDGDPDMCGYDEEGKLGDAEMRENSPQALKRYRRVSRKAPEYLVMN
ncbi:hypothetical protein N0V88_008172 [Collariella sp. IMI 366227]|nr:hypothetical protein N0V88_008172 [Collariella sp. IMI 366227]